jgi:hypothetical protein
VALDSLCYLSLVVLWPRFVSVADRVCNGA